MEFTFCEMKQWFNPGGEACDVLLHILVRTLFYHILKDRRGWCTEFYKMCRYQLLQKNCVKIV